MKRSIYNTIVGITNKRALIYNAYRNMFLIISQKHIEDIKLKDELYLKKEIPSIYEKLLQIGFFIDNNINEILALKKRIEEVNESNQNYILIINPTIQCNFRCWYCYEEHLPKSKMNNLTLDRIKKTINNIANTKDLKSFQLSFFGGEPLLYFDKIVVPIIEEFNACCRRKNIKKYISFTTNGYLITDDMIEVFKRLEVCSFQITLDGVQSDHDQVRYPSKGKGSYNKILSSIKKLSENQFHVIVRINYTVQNIQEIKNIANDIKNNQNVTVNFQRVWQDTELKTNFDLVNTHIEASVEAFREKGIIAAPVIYNMVANSCYADKKNQAVINYNGDLYKCTARDFKTEKRLGYLSENGELVWNNDIDNLSTIRFTKSICHRCRIAPLCGGGCFVKHIEATNPEICVFGLDEKAKDEVVLDNLYYNHILPNEIPITPST
jgi:uncharacterized protein